MDIASKPAGCVILSTLMRATITLPVACIFFPVFACRETPPCTTQPILQQSTTNTQNTTDPPYFAFDDIPTDPARYPYNHASSIIELPNGDLLVAWAAGSAEAARDTLILAARKTPGHAWSPPFVLADKPDAGDANPVLFVDPAGTLRLFHVELFGAGNLCLGRVMTQHSADHGVTWSATTPALDAICTLVRNKPIVLRDGRWLLPAYQEAIYQSQFWITDNQGTNWSALPAVFTFPVSNLQPAVVQLADGSLYALMRNGAAGGHTWEGRSTDCGRSWRMSQRADLPNPNSGLDLIRLADGRLLWAGNPSDSQRTPLAIAFSRDNGMTWSPPKTLESGLPQLSYPSLCRARNDRIHVSYSHRLTHIRHVELNVAWLEIEPSQAAD